jgi:YARHG domain
MRLKSTAIFLCLFVDCLFCFGQDKLDGAWTNGDLVFFNESVAKNRRLFQGGTLHEGGYSFFCESLSDTKMKIIGVSPDTADGSDYVGYGQKNYTLEYKKIDNFEILLLRDTNNLFDGFLLKLSPGSGFGGFIASNKINFQLAGRYSVQGIKDSIIFLSEEEKVIWKGQSRSYKFETQYDFPLDVITINGNSYLYKRKRKSLLLYEAKEKDDDFEPGKLLYSLLRNEGTVSSGDYLFASTLPLTNDILDFYSDDELKLIRNEIFARHGFIFTNPEMKKHFEKMPWYKPITETIPTDFSEIERLNIAAIKKTEANRKKHD